MSTINMVGSLRYSMNGKKRKTKSLNKAKRPKNVWTKTTSLSVMSPPSVKEYPSYTTSVVSPMSGKDVKWEQEKLKISSSYTVAPAYNKGAYQVVPRSEVECIGK